MSIWGPDPFENDDAADWVAMLEKESRLEYIVEAAEEVADPHHVGYVEIPECCIAVAAGELLVRLIDDSSRDEPLGQDAWLDLFLMSYDAARKNYGESGLSRGRAGVQ